MKKPYQKWIVLPDMQVPFQDDKTLRAIEAYMADVAKSSMPFDGLLNLGDLIDFDEISRWTEDTPRHRVGKTIRKSFDETDAIVVRHLDLIRRGNKKARFVVIEGNHDWRVEHLVDKQPELEGMLEIPAVLRFEERGIEWVPYWSEGTLFNLGNAHFIHGRYLNKYHAAKHVDLYGVPIFYGHTHDVMEFPKATLGNNKQLVGKSLGCLCTDKMRYIAGVPQNWTQAFAVFYIFPNGDFQEHTIKIFNHRFVVDGKVYDGRKKSGRGV